MNKTKTVVLLAGLFFFVVLGIIFISSRENGTFGGKEKELINDKNDYMNYVVTLETSKGEVKFETYAGEAPNTVENFVKLAKEGFYDGLTFHRVIDGFMIQ